MCVNNMPEGVHTPREASTIGHTWGGGLTPRAHLSELKNCGDVHEAVILRREPPPYLPAMVVAAWFVAHSANKAFRSGSSDVCR